MNQNVMTIYPAGTTNFDYQGYGTLYDAYSAEVTEASSTNGNITETMEITYPVNGVLSDKIVEGNLVKAQISKTDGDYQIFEIDETEKSDNTVITAYLNAYPYRVLRMSFTNGGKFGNFETLTRLLDYAKSYMPDLPTDFKITTNISNPINLAQTQTDPALTPEPTVFKDFSSLLDAILNKVSGQVKFGPRSIEILAHRGQDKSNIELRDDKNTNGISVKVDTTNIVNKIIPLLPVKDKDGNSTSETIVGRIVTPKDPFRFINFYSGQVVNVDTQDLANSYFSRTNCNYPVTTATVTTSMIDEDLSDIRLFDVVSVYSSRINYTAKLKVSERVFDVLAGAVDSFKLGTSSVNVFSTQTAAMNQVEQAVAIGNQALTSANGKNTNYYGDSKPTDGKEGDTWFHTVDGVSQMDQFTGGVWKNIVSDTFGKEVDKKVATAQAEASDAKTKAEEASSNAKTTAAKFDDTDQKAEQALNNSVSAQADASSAVAKAESTASEFGKVKQKADSAFSNAMSAQASASDAVSQASSAAADSKDAKQIAGDVSQSYKTLTDGSTMTIAELESGLAVKLTKSDLDGYATETWTQNKINATADGINGTISSIKGKVDSQTTSINDLKADSSSFKSQFTTVNNTLGKQTTDIGTLQATSKELTSGFNTLTSDNTTNKNDISQLKQTATEVSSTLETVRTQVQNSAVGTNLLLGTSGTLQTVTNASRYNVNLPAITPAVSTVDSDTTYTARVWISPASHDMQVQVAWTDSSGAPHYDSGNAISAGTSGYSTYTRTLTAGATIKYVTIVFITPQSSDSTVSYKEMKFEKGSSATDWCPNPLDNATVTAVSTLSQTVDGMKSDISKKIEQKDLNGYATQTWAQNQINTTANGINATISSVKSTVDGHTTSINDLKVDSTGFKSQFTTVNDTIGKHTTDIGTLQASTKSLSASFDSLNSDNDTNKHNISQLQASATAFNSTLLTVQQQVTDSSVGTNLLANTADNGVGLVSIQGDTSTPYYNAPMTRNDSYIEMTKPTAYEMYYRFCNTDSSMHNLKPGKTYTIQGDVYVSKGSVHFRSQYQANGGWDKWKGNESGNLATNTSGFVKVKYTFTIPSNATAFYLSWQVYNFDATTVFRFRRTKLEIGSNATDYSTNPLDNATVTALSSISQTIDSIQTTVRGKADQSQITQLSGLIEQKVSSTDFNNLSKNLELQTLYSADINNMKTNGHYFVHNLANTPLQGWVYVDVIGNGDDHIRQDVYRDNNNKHSYRHWFGSGWSDWSQGASESEITQLSDNINLKVSKDGVVNAINISKEGTSIYGNKLHITAATYIDNAVIKDAMISNVSADKMTTGTLNAANVNVINLNGSHIVSNSITSNQLASGSVTADKIQSGAIRVSLNNSLQRLEIGVDGMNLMSNDGAIIGRIHSNHMNYDSTFWGLSFDMSANGGDYMAWGAQNNGDVNGIYQTKLAWYRWSTHGYDGGFHFQDRVEFHNPVEFKNSIDTRANYLLKFGSTNVDNYSSVPYLGLAGGATKISFSPGSVWLSRHKNYYNMGAVIEGFSHYLGKAIFIPTGMRSDGRASSWSGVNIPSA